MGIVNDILGRRQGSADTQVIEAATGESLPSTLRRQGNAVVNRASDFYKANPKKVQAFGAVVAAVLLTRLRRGRG